MRRFNEIASRVHSDIPKLIDAFGEVISLRLALQKLEQTGHLEPAKDLVAARKEFLPFSMAAVELAKQLRVSEPFRETKIFNCPMTDRAFPGAPKNGQWIQTNTPLRSAMIDCGSEVKP